jgi:mRNA interferase YafQ
MMYAPVYTKQFERDIKRSQRRGKNLEKFKIIARALLIGEPLDAIHRDHRFVGNYAGRRECHLESDWLLIYKTEESHLIFERIGTHSDLFKK